MKPIIVGLALAGLAVAADEPIAPLGNYKPVERRHWAFQPRKNAAPPTFAGATDKGWVKTPIDAFILDGLKKAGLRPAPAADRATLIRRVTYDLLGLPPSPAEIDEFVRD